VFNDFRAMGSDATLKQPKHVMFLKEHQRFRTACLKTRVPDGYDEPSSPAHD
jgi:hypothetical protein